MTLGSARTRLAAGGIVRSAIALSAVVVAAGALWWVTAAGSGARSGVVLTADQQAARLYRRGAFALAAARFRDPLWRAATLYRAGEYKQAAALYAGFDTAEAAYDHGNALLMQGLYEQAIARYDRALALRPGWADAVTNRDIAVRRAERVKKEGGDMTGGKLGADDVVVGPSKGPTPASGTETVEGEAANDADLRAIWLRRVQTQPADFLRAKFAVQLAQRDAAAAGAP